jgi:HlyD family secretion protein
MQRPLAERGFIAGRTFADSRDTYEANRRRSEVVRTQQASDERLQSSQLAQLRASSASLNQSLELARASLDSLNLRAPVAGQLTSFAIQVGQSLQRGERLGQIDSNGRNKLRAQVDEFYLGRVAVGQVATAEVGGRTFQMRVSKIYPQVRNGAFEIDLQFIGAEPADLQRGQTVQARLTLGAPAQARMIPNGSFYNDTGGAWVFVVAPDGGSAVRRQVRLGRRNNDSIEILDGLDPGERVITSPYTGFVERDRLSLSGQ